MSEYRYFEYNWKETEQGQLINQGTAYYFTSGPMELKTMKDIVRNSLKKPNAVITILPEQVELDRDTYFAKGGWAPA